MRSWRRRQSHCRVRLRLCVHQLNKCVVECLSAEEKSSGVRQYTAECAPAISRARKQGPGAAAAQFLRLPSVAPTTAPRAHQTQRTYYLLCNKSSVDIMALLCNKLSSKMEFFWESQTDWSYKLKLALPWEEEEKVPYGQIIPLSFSLYLPGPALFGMSQSSHHIKRQDSLISIRMHALNISPDPDFFWQPFSFIVLNHFPEWHTIVIWDYSWQLVDRSGQVPNRIGHARAMTEQ